MSAKELIEIKTKLDVVFLLRHILLLYDETMGLG